MVDKDTILQVICGLMRRPQYLSQTDKYKLTLDDFSSLFEKYVFSAIYNLYKDGAESISVIDIDNYLSLHKEAKAVFDKNNGIEYLQDVLDFCDPDNFSFYYKRLKKLRCLEDLNKIGFDTSFLYEEDYSNPKAKEINDKFEELEVSDIFDIVRKKVMYTETLYSTGDASETAEANQDILELVKDLQVAPEIGAALQGDIFNYVCRGARPSKFYIRSASSGTGKTRAAIGDACKLSYPISFNTVNWCWEWTGDCEKTLFIATEQELEEVQTLVLAYLTGIDEEKILYGRYSEEEEKVVAQAIKVMDYFKDNLFVVRLSNPNIEQIRAVVRQNYLLHGIKNVFYDYIFSSPSLLNEFRDLHIREDVALGMLSTALKDLAVEMDLFVMSSTQTNAKSEEKQESKVKNESVIRGSRAIIDKCDLACVISRVTKEDLERLGEYLADKINEVKPNQVMDVYKVRRGRFTNVRIWSYVDLGTCRKTDLFMTNEYMELVDGYNEIKAISFEAPQDIQEKILKLRDQLNQEDKLRLDDLQSKKEEEIINVEEVTEEEKKKKGIFGEWL